MPIHRITNPKDIGIVNKQLTQQSAATAKELKKVRVLAKQVHLALTTVQGQQVLQNNPGPLPINGNFTINTSGPVLMLVSGSGFNTLANGFTMNISVDGTQRGQTSEFTNEVNSHKALPATFLILNLTAGSHTVTLSAGTNMSSDSNDHFNVAILELQAQK